jgi:hypothetical protein
MYDKMGKKIIIIHHDTLPQAANLMSESNHLDSVKFEEEE